MTRGLLITGASEIATLAGGVRRGPTQGDAASLVAVAGDRPPGRELALAVVDDAIAAVGEGDDVEVALRDRGVDPAVLEELDTTGRLVTPGLVDPHTHLLFAGTRER